MYRILYISLLCCALAQRQRTVGRFQEVFAWKQITYDINGVNLFQNRFGNDFVDEPNHHRMQRSSDNFIFQREEDEDKYYHPHTFTEKPNPSNPTSTQSTDERGKFFIQYNNVPMGVERVGDRLFVTVPRRRYGIPSTLNYINLREQYNNRSPSLKPYPDLRTSRSLISVYRTRADKCHRLWMVDTGILEIPNDRQQLKTPAIIIFDLQSDSIIQNYELKPSDLASVATPRGLASITVDITSTCEDAYAYIVDLVTNGIIVFSLRNKDSWRLSHNYFHFNPLAGNLNIGGQRFTWNDGIFSITLSPTNKDGCKTAYFHPMVSYQEFSVSTCLLKNQTAASDSGFWTNINYLGERGENSQSTMHGYHGGTGVIFYANIGNNAISCWNTKNKLTPSNFAVLAQDTKKMVYPSDLHVTGDEVWVMANTMPTFIYSSLNTDEYNFFIYKGNVKDVIAGTACGNNFTN